MIPKIIHYCWFGGKEMPPLLKLCIASWRKYLPGYQIKQWDESNFDFRMAPLCREAYAAKKWAFVADYCRVYALYTEGGIYMDTDIMVLRSFDEFLQYAFCSSQEYQPWVLEPVRSESVDSEGHRLPSVEYVPGLGIQSGVMMAEKGIPYLKDCMDFYNQLHLPQDLNSIVVVKILAKLMEPYGYRYITQDQYFPKYNIRIAVPSVFSNMTALTADSYAWHLYYKSWVGTGFSLKQHLRNTHPKIYTLLQLVLRRKWGIIPKILSLK